LRKIFEKILRKIRASLFCYKKVAQIDPIVIDTKQRDSKTQVSQGKTHALWKNGDKKKHFTNLKKLTPERRCKSLRLRAPETKEISYQKSNFLLIKNNFLLIKNNFLLIKNNFLLIKNNFLLIKNNFLCTNQKQCFNNLKQFFTTPSNFVLIKRNFYYTINISSK
jgi:hypothetical protein